LPNAANEIPPRQVEQILGNGPTPVREKLLPIRRDKFFNVLIFHHDQLQTTKAKIATNFPKRREKPQENPSLTVLDHVGAALGHIGAAFQDPLAHCRPR
jgi:hypothetical protein